MERRLAAILSYDVVGYSRAMGADESGTFETLKADRRDVINPLAGQHGGRIIKLMGDGGLMEFASVVDAVAFAVGMQSAIADRSAGLPEDRRLLYRIGINVGDVIVEGNDIYGDGVNVAARLEGLAKPGGICVRRNVRNQVRDKLDLDFEDLGEVEVKNIARPVRAFNVVLNDKAAALAAAPVDTPPRPKHLYRVWQAAAVVALAVLMFLAAAAWFAAPDFNAFDEDEALARPTGPTIAVMPFENLSGDPAQDYLASGLSEDVIVELGRFRDLNVLSRQTTSVYQGKAVDVRKLGKTLGADYVLEGTVRNIDERLRITGRLIDATSGAQVWSGAFDEALTAANLFEVQLQITERVASAVGDTDGAIKRIDARRARTKPPEQLSSYECSMFRLGFLYSTAMQERVRGCILRVVEEEPDYWRGWAQLADALRTEVMLFTTHYEGTHSEKLDRALSAARKAVSLNPESPRAYFVLGHILLLMGDRAGFYAAAESALALGGDRRVEGQIGYWMVWTGRLELGAALLRRAIELNPSLTRETWHRGLADYHFATQEYEAALEEYRKGAQPELWWSVAQEVAILAKLGRAEETRRALDRLYAARPDIKIADIVWLYRRFQRPEAETARYVEAFRKAGIAEGNYRPLDVNGSD